MTLQIHNLDHIIQKCRPHKFLILLNRALSEKEISPKEAEPLYAAKGIDFHLVGAVADELRKRRGWK